MVAGVPSVCIYTSLLPPLAGAVLLSRAAVVLARGLGVGADIDQGGFVAVCHSNAHNLASIAGSHSLDVDLAGATLALETISTLLGVTSPRAQTYCSAGAVDFSVVFGIKIDDLVTVLNLAT